MDQIKNIQNQPYKEIVTINQTLKHLIACSELLLYHWWNQEEQTKILETNMS